MPHCHGCEDNYHSRNDLLWCFECGLPWCEECLEENSLYEEGKTAFGWRAETPHQIDSCPDCCE